jgi:hypothetical protein
MSAIASCLTPAIVTNAAAIGAGLGSTALGYAAAGVWGFMNVYHTFTGIIQPIQTVGTGIGAILVAYHHGRVDRKYSIPESLFRAVAYAPLGAFMGYGFAPAVMPLGLAFGIIYIKGGVTIKWDVNGNLTDFKTEALAK